MPYSGKEYYDALKLNLQETGTKLEYKAQNELDETNKLIADAEAGGYVASFDNESNNVQNSNPKSNSIYIVIGAVLLLSIGVVVYFKKQGLIKKF